MLNPSGGEPSNNLNHKINMQTNIPLSQRLGYPCINITLQSKEGIYTK
jgi:hypothetical protein